MTSIELPAGLTLSALLLLAQSVTIIAETTLTTDQAIDHVGEMATVCGTVVSPSYRPDVRGEPTFLNLDRAYPDQIFTALIWGENRAAFGSPETALDGHRICVTGEIELYRGTAEMILTAPDQIAAD